MIKMIFKIAKAELQMLFYSPVAWLILVIFTVQAAYNFVGFFDGIVKNQEMGGMFRGISLAVFGGWEGVLTGMQKYLYFYIPLLTMGLVSRELSSGSIRLLYSSPITNFQIIVGKFMSMVIYGAIMMGILALFIIYALCTVHDFDLPAVLTGLLGLYLLTCAYAAIGIFMSSLTSYQIVAAVGTFGVLMGLNMVGGLWQSYDLIRDVTYWLAINGRCDTFISGMICSEDFLYFVIVVCLFLALTIIRLNAVRQKTKFIVTVGKNVGVILLACILGYLSSRPQLMCYHDATATKTNTLTPNSQNIIAKLDGGMTITTYINILEPETWYSMPDFQNPDKERFKQYLRFKPDMKLKYVYYYAKTENKRLDERYPDLNDRQRMVELCKMYEMDSTRFKSPEELKEIIDLSSEGYTFVRQVVRENGEKSWLRVYNDMQRFPGESETSAAFKRMIMQLPKVGFLQGHGERSYTDGKDRSYSLFANAKKFRYSLMNQGFDTESVTLDKEVPEHIKVLVISDMRELFKPEEEVFFQNYIDRGGNLFIAAEPKRREVMNPLLEKFGFEMTPGVLVKQDTVLLADVILSYPTKEADSIAYVFKALKRNRMVVTTPSCAGLEQIANKGYQVTTLFRTDTIGVWNELEMTDFVDDTVRLNPALGEVQKTYPTVIALSKKVGDKEQKILITGDADCISNSEFNGRSGVRSYNYSLIVGPFFWMSDNEMPIDIRRPPLPDDHLFLGLVGVKVTKGVFMVLIPLILMALGIFIWIRRRGR